MHDISLWFHFKYCLPFVLYIDKSNREAMDYLFIHCDMIGRCGLVFCLLTIVPRITLLKRTFWYCSGEFWKIIPLFVMWCIWRETFEGCELPYEVEVFVLKVSLWLDNGYCFIIFFKNFVTFWFFEFRSLIWCSFVCFSSIHSVC